MGLRNMTLYNLTGCPYCKIVQDRLAALGLAYETIEVPAARAQRHEVVAVSGQALVPVLVDGEQVIDDEEEIVTYLNRTYGHKKG
jgi:glutathione S-transferase